MATTSRSGFVLAFHGCDRVVGEHFIAGTVEPTAGEHRLDWLGRGIYFWENDPIRALEFAELKREREIKRDGSSAISEPFVVGAVLDLGACLDLTLRSAIEDLRAAHRVLAAAKATLGDPMPENSPDRDMLKRPLDYAVIETLHNMRRAQGLEEAQTVRGVFLEGEDAYDGSGFRCLTHCQIAVRDNSLIRGFFRVRPATVAL